MLERKGFGIRLGAYIIDVVIMAIAATVLMTAMLAVPIVGALLLIVLAVAYPAIEVLRAQSPGKMILGMKITGEDGAPATREQLITRTVIKFSPSIVGIVLSALSLIIGSTLISTLGSVAQLGLAIALLVMSWTPLQTVKQAFWDLKAKTAVMGKATAPIGFPVGQPGQPVQQNVPPMPPQA